MATFTGGAITQADLQKVIAQRLPAYPELSTRPGAVQELLDSLVRYDLLVQEAEKRGYRDDLVVRIAAQAKANELLLREATTVDPTSISAADIAQAFERQKREFSRPAMRRASHVLVASKAEAEALIKALKGSTREQFARAATEKSQDPGTKNQGGELGYFDREGQTERGAASQASPQLAAAAFKLRAVGDVTPQPISLPNGWSVLMLTGEMKAFQTPKAAADERLREELAKAQSTSKHEAFVAGLREKYKPVVHEALLDLVVMPPAPPSQIPAGFPAAPPDPREPPKMLEPDGI